MWEQLPVGLVDSAKDAEFSKPRSYGLFDLASTCEGMRRPKLHDPNAAVDWPILVRNYTTCKLTKQSDRLVAIAVSAKVLASAGKDQYVAGIWTKTLPDALGWKVIEQPDPEYYIHDPATQYYAPSFSWAAAESEVYLPKYRAEDRDYEASVSATFIKHREKPHSSVTNT